MDTAAKTPNFAPFNDMENDLTEGSPNTLSLAFVEGLYADYLRDPSSVAEDWQAYFAELTPDANFTN
jgi:2-oxoglutarate dehydrogenase complex dehydrogenase (E1) component-like enzyme